MGLQSQIEASLNVNLKFKTQLKTNDSSVYIISVVLL